MTYAFNPIVYAQQSREHRLYLRGLQSLEAFGEGGKGQAGSTTVDAIVTGWFAGERRPFEELLPLAVAWLDDAAHEARDYGGDPLRFAVAHACACAVGHWLLSSSLDGELWDKLAKKQRQLAEREGGAIPADEAAIVLRDLYIARHIDEVLAWLSDHPVTALNEILVLLSDVAATGATDAAKSQSIGKLLQLEIAEWTDQIPAIHHATWLLAGFRDTKLAAYPEHLLWTLYVLQPNLPLPDGLLANGFTDATEAIVTIGSPVHFAACADLVPRFGLIRDADATAQPDPPLFASWTRSSPFGLEADYHFDSALKSAWLEIRGEGAGRLAPILAKALGGKVAPTPDVAMAELLTPPPGADDSGTGRLRWQTLCAIVVAEAAPPTAIVQPMIRAGLADPDWRVRMVALIGAGRYCLRDLVGPIVAVSIPKAGAHGLNQDDRHTLLALRHAAKDLASGSNADIPGDNAETINRRRQFLESIKAFVQTLQLPNHPDRSHALLAALAAQSEADDKSFPATWAGWVDSTRTQ